MVNDRVFYVMSHPPHLPYLLASLKTLREHYDGEVVVFAWEESFPIVQEIAKDSRLGIEARFREPAHRDKNAQFMDKIQAAMSQQGEAACILYLDADTTIHGDLSPLFQAGREYGFAATRFCRWTSHHGIPSRRIEKLRKYKKLPQEAVEQSLDKNKTIPSVNGGVWACRPESPVLPLWYEYTDIAQDQFIADEVVLHLMSPIFAEVGNYTIIGLGGEYNCSPKFQPRNLGDKEVKIWHFHGDSNVRPGKIQKGYDLWRPIYAECLEMNLGNVSSWLDQINNKWMKLLERE